MKWIVFTFLCIAWVQIVMAQDNYEIQVYSSQTQPKYSTIFELHSNFTLNGEPNIVKGVLPSNHALHETIEITQGITDNFEIGYYLFTNYTSGYGYKIIGTHIRPRIMAPSNWNLPVGVSLSAEIGYQDQNYSPDTWNVELRPIIDKQWNKFYACINPTLGFSLKGVDKSSIPVFEPNIKLSYSFFKTAALGIEYYGGMGQINEFNPSPEQSHALFFVYDLLNNNDWELNVGPGFGLTKATDGLVFKILAGRKIQWHHKKA